MLDWTLLSFCLSYGPITAAVAAFPGIDGQPAGRIYAVVSLDKKLRRCIGAILGTLDWRWYQHAAADGAWDLRTMYHRLPPFCRRYLMCMYAAAVT
ncbi:hypothetical protein B0I35DRAFT_436396 [Stachybotrys elegans]|uniref:Uncharacterized protein n=1 Tax=Stachybotrys elegans TaxID=80388 RepID=A0A8K0SH47_9HYPO|nr:hypothetical protein B0I35DRAFT_436396 [Stachybotrys elegans]